MPAKRVLITSGYDLSRYVRIPEANMPVPARQSDENEAVIVYEDEAVKVTVIWFKIDLTANPPLVEVKPGNMFEAGETYEAKITLEITNTYLYYFSEAKPFRYSEGVVAEQSDPEKTDRDPYRRTVTVLFKPVKSPDSQVQKVLEYNLQRYVPVPVAGAIPVKELKQPHFDIRVVWTPDVSVFTKGAVYTAEITVTARDGYTFDPEFPFRYPDGTVDSPPAPDDNQLLRKMQVTYKPTEAPKPVGPVELSLHIPMPRSGQPLVSVFTGIGYMGSVEWFKEGETTKVSLPNTYESDTVYLADVTIYAAAGYILPPKEQITYSGIDKDKVWDKSGPVGITKTIEFPKTDQGGKITGTLDLTDFIPKPAIGATPITSFFVGPYRGIVEWTEERTDPPMTTPIFQPETVYTATVTLIPVAGYYFDGPVAVALTGSASVTNFIDVSDNGTRTGTITFEKTGPGLRITVNGSLDLTGFIPQPATGTTPVFNFSEGTYRGTVKWTETGKTEAVEVFHLDTEYTAEVTLIPAEGYLFPSDSFPVTHDGAIIPIGNFTASGNDRTGKIGFPLTDSSTEITGPLNLTSFIPKPVTSGTPVVSFFGGKYRGTVKWTETGKTEVVAVFQPGTEYTATVTLTPEKAPGYAYSFGDGPVEVTHDGTIIPVGSFTASGNDRTGDITFDKTDPGTVIDDPSFDLTNFIPKPVTGATPVLNFFGGKYRGAVVWKVGSEKMTVGTTFKSETVYTTEVTLTPMAGYVFPASVTVKYTGMTDITFTGSGNVRTGSITFTEKTDQGTPIGSSLNLASIPKPATGVAPVVSFTGVGYTGHVVWKEGEGDNPPDMPPGTTFKPGTRYKAVVTLIPVAGYYFHDDSVTVTHANASPSSTIFTGSDNVRNGDIDFGKTDPGSTVLNNLTLTSFIPQPVTGNAPVGSFAGAGYTGTVAWKKVSGGNALPMTTPTFQPGTGYTATVTLIPVAGYVFPASVTVTHTGSKTVGGFTGSPNIQTGTITFEATGDGLISLPSTINLTNFIPKPAIGDAPVASFSGGNYTGAVVWKEGSPQKAMTTTTFQPNTVYTATVTLTPMAGYVFPNGNVTVKYTDMTDMTFVSSGNIRTGSIEFTATNSIGVSDLDLAPYISRPVFGKQPEKKDGVQYTIDITSWSPTVPADGFTFFDEYTATVTLTAKPGYIFNSAQKFSYTGAEVPPADQKLENGKFSLKIVFPAPDPAQDTTKIALPFSGLASKKDSVIDVIRESTGKTSLNLTLEEVFPEQIQFVKTLDFGKEGGLVLELGNSPEKLTIDGGGRVITLVGRNNVNEKPVITVEDGVTLTLKNITFKGVANNSTALIVVESGGTLNLESGAELSENIIADRPAGQDRTIPGGLWIWGKVVMKAGAIIADNHGFTGGGVVVEPGGVFTMNGGEISGNVSEGSGGGVLVNAGTFTMTDGTIEGNTSLASHNMIVSGNRHGGGGVWVLGVAGKMAFKMEGGTIKNNKAVESSDGGYGGGVFISGIYWAQGWDPEWVSEFKKTGGTIEKNTSGNTKGNQVYATVWGYTNNGTKYLDYKRENSVEDRLTYTPVVIPPPPDDPNEVEKITTEGVWEEIDSIAH